MSVRPRRDARQFRRYHFWRYRDQNVPQCITRATESRLRENPYGFASRDNPRGERSRVAALLVGVSSVQVELGAVGFERLPLPLFVFLEPELEFFVFPPRRRGFDRADSEYTDKLQHYTSGHSE